MEKPEFKCLLISDSNINNLGGYLENDGDLPVVKTTVAPYGQVLQILMQDDPEIWDRDIDCIIVWTQPNNIIGSFNQLLGYNSISIDKLFEEIDEFTRALIKIKEKANVIFFPTWVLPYYHRGFGMLDMQSNMGITNILMRMNLRLSENLEKYPNIYLMNTQRWITLAGKSAFNPKLWYMGKIAFGNDVFKEAVKDIKAALRGVRGDSKKIIILDLDDTIWGGIVGDDGWENLVLGGHDPVGEAFVDFQRELKALTNRGLLLGIVSKNEEAVALEAIDKHPEMILKQDDFAGWSINWEDKARNIENLISELNLGLQSVVFIDDNPAERARVRDMLPEVLVPEWPEDKMMYNKTLHTLACFDSSSISKEDIKRSKMYAVERQRSNLKSRVGSLDEWLNTLEIEVKVEKLNEANLPRTTQLLNKTNQMNLSTRRMSESELVSWAAHKDHWVWTFRVSDKFGDLGLTGIISVERDGEIAKIVDYILSCRVFGRKVEELMVHIAVKHARSQGMKEICARYIPTSKNKPCLDFWLKSGFTTDEVDSTFYWQLKNEYAAPNHIALEIIL